MVDAAGEEVSLFASSFFPRMLSMEKEERVLTGELAFSLLVEGLMAATA